MKKIALIFLILFSSCESYLMEHIVEVEYKEELIYKPTIVSIKFLYITETMQVSGVDTIYLDGPEKVIWDISDRPGAQVQILHFTLEPVD